MKTLLFLGAARFQIPPIEYALKAGYRVLTCDNRPTNPGHALAHRAFNVSTVDVGSVLHLARTEKIDGILTFGSDVSALTAALVAEELGLPGNPSKTIQLLTDKVRFRTLLAKRDLQGLPFYCVTPESIAQVAAEVSVCSERWIVKPVDASGSKGVRVIEPGSSVQIEESIHYALGFSRSKQAIVEKFAARRGPQVCGDGYFQNGKVVFIEYGDGWFHDSGESWAPYGETFPSIHEPAKLNQLTALIEKALIESGFREGPFNQDSFFLQDGTPFLIEIGPRCGGNYLPHAIRRRTGVDLVAASVECALGHPVTLSPSSHAAEPAVACYMVHSHRDGRFFGTRIDHQAQTFVREMNPYVEKGEIVRAFVNGSHSLANLVLEFPSEALMHETMRSASTLFEALIEEDK